MSKIAIIGPWELVELANWVKGSGMAPLLMHPPLGMNHFIIQKLAKETPYIETATGVMPFLASALLRIVLLLLVPGISLWLVHLNA